MFDSGVLLALGLAVLVGAVVVGLHLRARRGHRKAFLELAKAQHGELRGSTFVVRREGTEFRCTFDPGSRRRAPSLRILVPVDSPLNCTIARKGALVRIAERLRLRTHSLTGDPTFDRDLAVRTNTPDEVRAFLDDPERRGRVRRLLDEGWSRLVFHPGSFEAVRIPVTPGRDLDPQHLEVIYRRMRELAGELPAIPPGDRWLHLERMRHSAVPAFLGALILLLLCAVVLWGWGWIAYPPVRPYRLFAATLPVTALLFLPMALWMSDRLEADMHTLGKGIYVVVFLFLSVFVHGGAMVLNGALDRTPPQVHHGLAVSFIDRGSFPARIRLEAWEGEGERTVRVRNSEARQLSGRSPWRLTLAVQPGAFGHEWVAWARAE
jgi:hypothetical protein